MGNKNKTLVFNSFYCLNCGNKVYDLPRNRGYLHEKFHRKKLYCPVCKHECNCIECGNDEEIFEFKEAFAAGEYKEEAQASIDYIKEKG